MVVLDSTDMSLSKLQEIVKDRETMGLQRDTTEQLNNTCCNMTYLKQNDEQDCRKIQSFSYFSGISMMHISSLKK